jgi:hypothetical protein
VLLGNDCSAVSTTVTRTETPGSCDDEYDVAWTAIAMDECGFESEALAHPVTTVVQDTSAPTWDASNPATPNHSAQCGWDDLAPVLAASDSCGVATVTDSEDKTTTTCGFTLVRSWEAVNTCGHSDF